MASKTSHKKPDPSPKLTKKTKTIAANIPAKSFRAPEAERAEMNAFAEQQVEERTREPDQVSQKIIQAQDLFYALFHANPIPIALTRLEDGTFMNVNDEFLTYFGLQREDVIGHRPEDLGIGLDPALRSALFAHAKNKGGLRNIEAQTLHTSGEQRNIVTSLQYVNIDNTEAVISAFVDITDRVRAEQQIRVLASELTAAEQAERHHLSQVLHDDLQQRIFAIQMQMSFLRDAYEKGDLKAFAVDFPQLEIWLAEAIQVTRQLSVDLSPPILHGEGLVEAVFWLASQMQDQYGLEVSIRSEGEAEELDEKVRVLLFYAIRELLFNIAKHSGTLKAMVDFEYRDRRLRLKVSDQGKGFAYAEVMNNPQTAHGLLIVRHRLNLLGYSMDVRSEPGKGTEVIIELPNQQMDSGL